jgi:NAD(P)-dependent dehydrogenase (short-subunit alcohol dehydrogenase family)
MKEIMGKQRLKTKVAIITGGGKGIGRAIVLGFAKEGANVVVVGRTTSYLEEVCREVRSMAAAALPVKADVSVEREVESMVGDALKVFGKVDILVNNAGIPGPLGVITGIGKEEWDDVLGTNLTGMFLCSRAVLRHMMERRAGNIINLSSGAGWRGGGVRSLPYNVSKFGVEGFTHALALQMKPYNICVNALRPGRHDTDFHKDSPSEYRVGMRKPDDVSRLAVFLALQTVDTMTGESIDLREWEKKFEAPP